MNPHKNISITITRRAFTEKMKLLDESTTRESIVYKHINPFWIKSNETDK